VHKEWYGLCAMLLSFMAEYLIDKNPSLLEKN
jgi:hypothetical protein